MGWFSSSKPAPTVEKTPEELEEEHNQLEIQKIEDALESLEDEDVEMLQNNKFFKDTLTNENRDYHLVKELIGYMDSLIEDKECNQYKNIQIILTMFQPFLFSESAKEKIFNIMTQKDITNKCKNGNTIQQLIANVFTNYEDKQGLITLLQNELKGETNILNNLSVKNPRSKEKNDAKINKLKASLQPLLQVLGWLEQQGWEPPASVQKKKEKAPGGQPVSVQKKKEKAPGGQPVSVQKKKEKAPGGQPVSVQKKKEKAPGGQPVSVQKKKEKAPGGQPVSVQKKTVGGTRKKCKSMRKNRTRK